MLHRELFFLLLCGATCAAAAHAQTAQRDDYDANYLGPRMADPVLQHSKETYVVFGCSYCHGLYLTPRGEAADLMHSRLVGKDQNANLIGPLLRAGIPQTAKLSPMPQYSDLSERQIADIARWIHYARQQGRWKELSQAALGDGNAERGKTYFEQACAACHPEAGALAGIARRKDSHALRLEILNPAKLQATASWNIEKMREEARWDAARQRHLALLENYSADEIEDLTAYLQSLP